MNTVLEDTARYYMWKRLGVTGSTKAKNSYARRLGLFSGLAIKPSAEDYIKASEYPLDCNTGRPRIPLALKDWSYYANVPVATMTTQDDLTVVFTNNNKKEKNMCYDDCDCDFCDRPKSDEAKKRSYMSERLDAIARTKEREAYTTFGLNDDPRPETFEDLFARLTAGKYVLSDEKKKQKHWYPGHILDQIRWRDPAVKEDQDGFAAWKQKLIAAQTKTEDMIQVAPVEDALTALTAFESAAIN